MKNADPGFNLEHTLELARRADQARCVLAVYPELGLSGYANDDLFFQDALLARTREALVALFLARVRPISSRVNSAGRYTNRLGAKNGE